MELEAMTPRPERGMVHKVIRKRDGISDFTACDTNLSYLDPANDEWSNVTCPVCLARKPKGRMDDDV
jgi:hypothetical protein